VIAGTITLVATQCTIKFVEPCFQLKKLIGEIATDLDFSGNVSEHDPERLKAAAECFRRRASELRGSLNAILLYDYFSDLIGLPTEKEIIAASRALIGHSNFLLEKLNPPDPRFAAHGRRGEIQKLLRLKGFE
jgi:hypothetical protein